MTNPVAVVGGTGFIGSHVVDRLAKEGLPVRVLSRSGRWRWGREPEGVDIVRLDLSDPGCPRVLRECLGDTRVVVNLAGRLYRPGMPARELHALHVDGARRVASALPSGGRLVHVSTTGVIGPTGTEPLDETAAPRPSTPYEATKLDGEQAVLSDRSDEREVVVIRPGLTYGPRDLHLLPLFRSIQSGSFRLIGGGKARWQPVFAQDVATAIVEATRRPDVGGEVMHVAGVEPVTVSDLAGRIAGLLGTRIRRPGLPYGLAFTAGLALEAVYRPLGVEPPLSRARVRTLTTHRAYAIDRAREKLGFSPQTGLDDGLRETVRWYRNHGHL